MALTGKIDLINGTWVPVVSGGTVDKAICVGSSPIVIATVTDPVAGGLTYGDGFPCNGGDRIPLPAGMDVWAMAQNDNSSVWVMDNGL